MTAIFGTRKKPRFWGYMIISNSMSIIYILLFQGLIETPDSCDVKSMIHYVTTLFASSTFLPITCSNESLAFWIALIAWVVFSNGAWFWLTRG